MYLVVEKGWISLTRICKSQFLRNLTEVDCNDRKEKHEIPLLSNACLNQRNPTLRLHKDFKFLVVHNFCDPGVTLVQKINKEALKPNCPGPQLTGLSRGENMGSAFLLRAK